MGTERGGCSRLMKTPRHNGGAVHSRSMRTKKKDKGHTLMQAIARANRVYPNKQCGIIVDY